MSAQSLKGFYSPTASWCFSNSYCLFASASFIGRGVYKKEQAFLGRNTGYPATKNDGSNAAGQVVEEAIVMTKLSRATRLIRRSVAERGRSIICQGSPLPDTGSQRGWAGPRVYQPITV